MIVGILFFSAFSPPAQSRIAQPESASTRIETNALGDLRGDSKFEALKSQMIYDFNFRKADIREVASMFSRLLERKLIISNKVRCRVDIHPKTDGTFEQRLLLFTKAARHSGCQVKFRNRTIEISDEKPVRRK